MSTMEVLTTESQNAADYVENFDQSIRPPAEESGKYIGASDADVEKVSTMEVFTTESYNATEFVKVFAHFQQPLLKECRKYVGASDADVEKVATLQVLTTQTQNCLQYCVFSKAGLMDGTTFASEYDILKLYNYVHKDDEKFLAQGPKTINEFLAEASKLKTDDPCILANFGRQFVLDKSFSLVIRPEVECSRN
ncbi:uncharacterized protein [Anabrus simplex]|uniref:uncharacterized protein n=1 Tax=Anabrus simplex TaxID=316456 RepID=UPI0035A30EF1